MGYQTNYKLRVTPKLKLTEEDFGDFDHQCVEDLLGKWGLDAKWYEHQDTMVALSKRHPKHLFTLNGEGEESGDIWVKYFKNGKVQEEYLPTTLPPFDETKLKEIP